MTQKINYQPLKQTIKFAIHRHKSPSSGLKMPKNYELKAIKLTSLALTTFLVTLFAASILAPVQPSRASEVLLANQATGGSISLTTSGNVNLSLESSTTGVVRTALDQVRVTAGSTGYQLYLSTAGDNSDLVRDGATATGSNPTTYASTDVIPTLGGATITAPTTLSNDTWGFAVAAKDGASGSGSEDVVANGFLSADQYPTGDNSSQDSTFASIPASNNTPVLIASNSTTANNVLTNVYYGARVTTAKPSGTYRNTIVYTAISNSSTSNLASVSPSRTSLLAGGETLTITTPSTLALTDLDTNSINITVGGSTCVNPTAYKNEAYLNFTCTSPALATGWHEVVVSFTTTASTTETYVVDPGIEYYSDATAITNTFQDFSIADCQSLNVGQTITLKDSRDGKTYTVARLADNNCWQTQNLRLGDPNQDITLTSADSDVTTSFTLPKAQTSEGIDWSTNIDEAHTYSFAENTAVSANNKILYGNLYNWFTATAGTGTSSVTSGDTYNSICPKNWKLPPSRGNGSFNNLFQSAGLIPSDSNTITNFVATQPPYSIPYAGYYNNSSTHSGNNAPIWLRTAYSTTISYIVDFFKTGTSHLGEPSGKKVIGHAVRCVMTTSVPTYLQELTSALCTNLTTAQTLTLTDARDNNTYTVARLVDNNCWTTQNLRLGSSPITLTSANTDLSTTFPITSSDIQTTDGTNWSTNYDVTHVYARPASSGGNLYNWFTSTAGTGTTSLTTTDAPSSICPTGWKLPPNTNNGSYANLLTSAGFPTTTSDSAEDTVNILLASPYNFTINGVYTATPAIEHTAYNHYWSRTPVSDATAYNFDLGTYRYGSSFSDYKSIGTSVRCVLVASN